MHEQPPPSRSLFRLVGTAMVALFLLGFALSASATGTAPPRGGGLPLKDTPAGPVPCAASTPEPVQAQLGPPVCPRLQSAASPFGPVLLTEDSSLKRRLQSLVQERADDVVVPHHFPLPSLLPLLRLPLEQYEASPLLSWHVPNLFAMPPPASIPLC